MKSTKLLFRVIRYPKLRSPLPPSVAAGLVSKFH